MKYANYDIASAMAANLKDVHAMLKKSNDTEELDTYVSIVRTASAPSKRAKIASALDHLNRAAELYEAVGDARRAYFATKLLSKIASDLEHISFEDDLPPETVRMSDLPSEEEPEWAEFLRDEDNRELDDVGKDGLGFSYISDPDHKMRIAPEVWKAIKEMTPEQREYMLSSPELFDEEERVDIDPDQISEEEAHPWFGKDEEKDY